MREYKAKRNPDRCPVHPGAIGGPGIWVRMQADYDTWHAERNVDVSKIPTLKVA
jgi:hypothetical protein